MEEDCAEMRAVDEMLDIEESCGWEFAEMRAMDKGGGLSAEVIDVV